MVAKTFIRLTYRLCVCAIRGLFRLCVAFAASMPTDLGPSLSLESMTQEHPEMDATTELGAESEEEHREEMMEGPVIEDVELESGGSGSEGVILEREVGLEDSIRESEGDTEADEVDVLDRDNRPEFWEWSHDWEDLDWVEEVWLEDEVVPADLHEATLPDEVWE
jgi:hypothetical protein